MSRSRAPVVAIAAVVVLATTTTGVGLLYLWRRSCRQRTSSSDKNATKGTACRPHQANATESLYTAHRQSLRKVSSSQQGGVVNNQKKKKREDYRDASLHQTMVDCQATKARLQKVQDPEVARKQKLRDLKIRQIKAAGQGPLGLSPDQLSHLRSSLRVVHGKS